MSLIVTLFPLLTVTIDVPIDTPIITGDVTCGRRKQATFNFREPNGWLRLSANDVSFAVSIATRNSEQDEWRWGFIRNVNGIFMTGSDTYAQIVVWTHLTTTVKYSAGYVYLGYNGRTCNRLTVSTAFYSYVPEFERAMLDCVIDGEALNELQLDGGVMPNVRAVMYYDGKSVPFTGTKLIGSAIAISYTGSGETSSNLIVRTKVVRQTKINGDLIVRPVIPCLVYESKEYEPLIDGMCSNYSNCVKKENSHSNDDEGGRSFLSAGAIVGAVFGILFGVAVLVVIVYCHQKCRSMRVMNVNPESKEKKGHDHDSSTSSSSSRFGVPPPCQCRPMRSEPKFSSVHHPQVSTDQRHTGHLGCNFRQQHVLPGPAADVMYPEVYPIPCEQSYPRPRYPYQNEYRPYSPPFPPPADA